MDGYKAYQYYTAIKIHFKDKKFNVFVNKGRLRGSYETYAKRYDVGIFEKLSRMFKDRDFILFCASNCMYGNFDLIYNLEEAKFNYMEFIKRRQSMSYVFKTDLDAIINNSTFYNETIIYNMWVQKKITLETLVILNELSDFINSFEEKNKQLTLMLEQDILRIKKSTGFVKYDVEKTKVILNNFSEDLKSING